MYTAAGGTCARRRVARRKENRPRESNPHCAGTGLKPRVLPLDQSGFGRWRGASGLVVLIVGRRRRLRRRAGVQNRSGLMGGLVALARAVGVRFPRAVRFFARRGARAQVRAAMYIGDRPLWRAVLFPSPLTRAVHYDARRRPDGVAAPRNPIPRTVAPYFNQSIINVASTAPGRVER